MLYAFCFEHVGVVVGDLYFVDPDPPPGQEGAERGVRLEVRLLERPPLPGSVYSAQPIAVAEPIWRVDLLERVDGPYGSFDRTHHHPSFRGWEPGHRVYDDGLSGDPIGWVGEQLADLETLVDRSTVDASALHPDDAAQLRATVPEILRTVRNMLQRVYDGELGQPPHEVAASGAIRNGWL